MSDPWVEAEFEKIFREHYARIVRISRRVLRRSSEAEEVCAEVFLRLYRGGPGVAANGPVGGWLYRTATRASIDALRANQRHGAQEDLGNDGVDHGEDVTDGPLTLLLREERIFEVREILAKLDVEKAQVLLLRHDGLTYQEIADALQLSFNSVGKKLSRAEAEFAMLFDRHQRRSRRPSQLHTAKEEQ